MTVKASTKPALLFALMLVLAGCSSTSNDEPAFATTTTQAENTTTTATTVAASTTSTVAPEESDDGWKKADYIPDLEVPEGIEGQCITQKPVWVADAPPVALDMTELRTICDLFIPRSETSVTVEANYYGKWNWGPNQYGLPSEEVPRLIGEYLTSINNFNLTEASYAAGCNKSWFSLNTTYDPKNHFPYSQTYTVDIYYPCMANPGRTVETLNFAAESTHQITLDDVFGIDKDWEVSLGEIIAVSEPTNCIREPWVNVGKPEHLTDTAFTLTQDNLIVYQFSFGVCGEEAIPVPWSSLTHLLDQSNVICETVDPAALELPAGSNWDDLSLRPTYGGLLLIPMSYLTDASFDYGNCGTGGALVGPLDTPSTAFTITWLDPANDRNQIRHQAAQVSSDWAIINDEQRVIDPTGVIEQALLALDPDLTGQNVRIVRRAACRFDFYATTLDGVTTEGSWVPQWGSGEWDEAEMTGYTMLMITGLNQAVTAEGQASSRSFGGASMEWTNPDGFWRQFYETSGFFGHLRLYGDDMGNRMYFPPIDDDCFALSTAVLDGVTRSVANRPTSATSREPDCAPGENTQARTITWGRVRSEGESGLAPLQELVSDRCYWENRDDFQRYEWPQETTTVTNTDITPLNGIIIGVKETATNDQFIVAHIGGPLDPDDGGPTTSHYCCDTPFTINTYQWDSQWVLVDDPDEANRFTSTENLALAPILAVNPSFEGCDLTKTPEESENLNYTVIGVEINCEFAVPSTGIWFSETFNYPIVEGTGNDEGINNDTRAFFARGLSDQLNEVLIHEGWFGHYWFNEHFKVVYQDNNSFSLSRSTSYNTGGTGSPSVNEVATYEVSTGQKVEIEDLFIPGVDWRTEFETSAEATEEHSCPWGHEEVLSAQHAFWPTDQGLLSGIFYKTHIDCQFVSFLAPWGDLAEVIDPSGPASHFLAE
ncbi:MAG TPA: hypothetical protein EYQ49_01275 [Acidimicrobiia bacterium]|nr:hypothetical protein [Acidimicrobiia bacterium]